MRNRQTSFAPPLLGALLLAWVAARVAAGGNFDRVDGLSTAVGGLCLGWGLWVWLRVHFGRGDLLNRTQDALDDIAALLDPLARPATSEQPQASDEAHAPGKAHRR